MIKRETVTSLLAGFLVGACGIAPVVAGDGFSFGPAQGAASGGGGSGDLTAITETGSGLTITSGTGPVPDLALEAGLEAIAGLAKTDGNVIVGDGSTWVAESGATARASLGALGGSLGSTDNVLLRSDGTGGVTAQGSTGTVLDDSGNLGVKSYSGSVAAISTVTLLDPYDGAVQSITLSATMSGDATFSVDTTNLSASYARTWEVVVTATGGPWTLQFDADWTWISAKPTTIASGGKAVLYLRSYGAAETDVVACWVVRDSG